MTPTTGHNNDPLALPATVRKNSDAARPYLSPDISTFRRPRTMRTAEAQARQLELNRQLADIDREAAGLDSSAPASPSSAPASSSSAPASSSSQLTILNETQWVTLATKVKFSLKDLKDTTTIKGQTITGKDLQNIHQLLLLLIRPCL